MVTWVIQMPDVCQTRETINVFLCLKNYLRSFIINKLALRVYKICWFIRQLGEEQFWDYLCKNIFRFDEICSVHKLLTLLITVSKVCNISIKTKQKGMYNYQR